MRHSRRPVLSLLALVVVSASGCDPKKPVAEADAGLPLVASATVHASAQPSASANPSSAAGPAVSSRKDPGFAMLGLGGRLQVEKINRPTGTLRAEAVYSGIIDTLKIPLPTRQQVAGYTVLAGYCEEAATAGNTLNLVVCEYDDHETMVKGKEMSANVNVARREFVTNKNTWVSVRRLAETPETTDQANKIVALVKTL